MSIIFTLTITELELYPTFENYQNVVFRIHWKYEGVLSTGSVEHKDYVTGVESIHTDNLQNFVPFEQLTEEMVKSWIEPSIDFNMIQNVITNHIHESQNKTETHQPPWAN